jgi:hypothetical protein
VLLVDDDQAQVGHGGEDGRAGADHQPRRAGGEGAPGVVPLAVGEVAVPDHGAGAAGLFKACPQPAHGLRGEGDLGHQVDGAAAGREDGLQGGEVHLGLAGTGDAVQQVHGEATGGEGRADGGDRGVLLVVELVTGGGGGGEPLAVGGGILVGVAVDRARLFGEHALGGQRVGDGRAQAEPGEDRAARQGDGVQLPGEKCVQRGLARRAAGELGQFGSIEAAGEADAPFQAGPHALAQGGRDHRLEGRVEAGRVVGGHPVGEPQQGRGQHRKGLFQAVDVAQVVCLQGRIVAKVFDHREHGAVEQGDADQHARLRLAGKRGRDAVAERFADAGEGQHGQGGVHAAK